MDFGQVLEEEFEEIRGDGFGITEREKRAARRDLRGRVGEEG